jgi:hypothetical protein
VTGLQLKSLMLYSTPLSTLSWKPECHYEDKDIGSLDTGPGFVCIHGRIVNFYDQPSTVKKPKGARGCVKLIIKDDTGTFTVGFAIANKCLFYLIVG